MPLNMDTSTPSDSQSVASKPKRAVSITLNVSSDDNIRTRRFTLKPSSQAIRVGRSSRTEENYMPAMENAWFESRVMSRNHAAFRAFPEEQKLCLCDDGSMHGSYVNSKKVAPRQMHPLQSGDQIVFGCEIVRGPEKFAPVGATIEFDWHDAPCSRITNRSFMVPSVSDYEDDEVDFLQESICTPIASKESNDLEGDSRKLAIPESDASSAGSFDHSETTSKDDFPVSAFKLHKDNQDAKMSNLRADRASTGHSTFAGTSRSRDVETLRSKEADGVASIPIKMSMVQPSSTVIDPTSMDTPERHEGPTSVVNGLSGPPKTDSTRKSPEACFTEVDSDEEIPSQLSLESVRPPTDSISSPTEMMDDKACLNIRTSNRGRKLLSNDKENIRGSFDEFCDGVASDVESIHTDDSESHGSDVSEVAFNDENMPTSSTYTRSFQAPVSKEAKIITPSTLSKQGPVPTIEAYSYVREPSPSDAAMAKPALPTNTSPPPRSFGTEWRNVYHVPMTSDYALSRAGDSGQYSNLIPPLPSDYYGHVEPAPALRPYTEGPFSSFSEIAGASLGAGLDGVPSQLQTHNPWATSPVPETAPKPTTKVSIDSIVEKPRSSVSETKSTSKLKRKFAEMANDDDQVEESYTCTSIEDAFLDAQPQTIVQKEIASTPEPSDLDVSQISNTPKTVASSERPAKRVKLSLEEHPDVTPVRRHSRTKQFAKYAATAMGGALVGAVGMVGALVALPEGFFG